MVFSALLISVLGVHGASWGWVKEIRRRTIEINLHDRLPCLFIQGQPLTQIFIPVSIFKKSFRVDGIFRHRAGLP